MKQFDSGAKSSEEAPRYDLIPRASLRRQALRMAQGAASHGERNYRKGATDPTFVRDRINHLLGHALAYAAGDRSEDHLGAVLANAGMLADLEELGATPAHDELYALSTPCAGGCGKVRYPAGTCRQCQATAAARRVMKSPTTRPVSRRGSDVIR